MNKQLFLMLVKTALNDRDHKARTREYAVSFLFDLTRNRPKIIERQRIIKDVLVYVVKEQFVDKTTLFS